MYSDYVRLRPLLWCDTLRDHASYHRVRFSIDHQIIIIHFVSINGHRSRSKKQIENKQTMGNGRSLSSAERAVVIAMSKTKMSQRAIAARVNRSKTAAIQHVLRDHTTDERHSKVKRPSKVSSILSRLIGSTAKKDELSTSQLVNKLGIDVSVRTVQHILQNDYFTEYVSMKARTNLTPVHKQKRPKWEREMVVKCASFWHKVTFTDKKRWCLDGPDGCNNYWAYKRLPREVSRSESMEVEA